MSGPRALLARAARRLAGPQPRPLPIPPADPGRSVGFWCILRYLRDAGIPGDLVECGVGYGHSFYLLGRWARLLGVTDRALWGFDGFTGRPTPTLADAAPRLPRAGEGADARPDWVQRHFDANYLGEYFRAHVRLVSGPFDRSLATAPVERVAFLHVDCDLYASYAAALDALGPRLERRAVVVYDEYASLRWPGATRAVDERLARMGHALLYSSLMHRYLSCDAGWLAGGDPTLARLVDELSATPAAPGAAAPL